MYSWVSGYPHGLFDRGILKRVYSNREERFLSISEFYDRGWKIQGVSGEGLNEYVFYSNTPEDLKEAVQEFMTGTESEGRTDLQDTANKIRRKKAREIVQSEELSPGSTWMKKVMRYRLASEVESAQGTICNRYLQKYWQ